MSRDSFFSKLFVCKNVYIWCEFGETTGCYFRTTKDDVIEQLNRFPDEQEIDAHEYNEELWIG